MITKDIATTSKESKSQDNIDKVLKLSLLNLLKKVDFTNEITTNAVKEIGLIINQIGSQISQYFSTSKLTN